MRDELTSEARIRIECLHAAVRMDGQVGRPSDRITRILRAAKEFEGYVYGNTPTAIPLAIHPEEGEDDDIRIVLFIRDDIGNQVTPSTFIPTEFNGWTINVNSEGEHVHLPRQHRDMRPPWCDNCKLTIDLKKPKVLKTAFKAGPIIHQEPRCTDNPTCSYQEPHRHGFACDKSCTLCEGKCHFDCPAHEEYHANIEPKDGK